MLRRTASARTAAVLALWILGTATSSATPIPESPLADASENQDWAKVRELCSQHLDQDACQADGMTALHWAAHYDHLETAGRLLAAGADAKATNRYGVTPLSLACTNGNAALIAALLAAGADANSALRGGESALMTAARTGRVAAVEVLLAHGAATDASDHRGQTAMMWAAADGHAAVVEALISAGANVSTRLDSGFNAMFFAVREGRSEVVRALLGAGVDVNATMQKGQGPSEGRADKGTSALILAVENGHFDLAVSLLEAGADPDDQRSGFTPLHALTWVRKPNRGDDADGAPPPIGSGETSSLQFIERLLEHGAEINTPLQHGASGGGQLGKKGATPFLLAAKTADLPMLQLLVEHGADPLLPNADGCTPLMAAAGIGTRAPTEEAGTEAEALEAVDYILRLGGELDTVDNNGETAMHGAAYKSLPRMVQFLADQGADIAIWNRKNRSGWTPLLIAQGFRPGNFKPAAETIDALCRVMRGAGVTPPDAPPRPTATGRRD